MEPPFDDLLLGAALQLGALTQARAGRRRLGEPTPVDDPTLLADLDHITKQLWLARARVAAALAVPPPAAPVEGDNILHFQPKGRTP